MKVHHLMGSAPYYTNCFLLTDNMGNAVLIDCSIKWEKIEEILKNDKAELKAILMTHGHHDHRECFDEVVKNSGAPVYMGRSDIAQFHLSDVCTEYKDKEAFEIGEMKIFAFHTPGHTQGSYCFKCEDMLFSGDTLFAGTVGRTDLPGGDFETIMKSMRVIAEVIKNQNPKVMPGHAHFSTFNIEKVQNPYLKEAIKCL
ncbi:MAG: MBL fold metallo-hydrolase [Oscillospiraceae bacterium]|nr:MBL fold metallo-hydrolase [Oscillospiraceae bacterium]